MAESKEATELKRIYAKHGDINNEEFRQCVEPFFFYIQNRYIGYRVPEIDGDFWAQLVKSMEYFDSTRTNIVSWVHTIGRNACSSYNYHKGKRDREDEEGLTEIPDEKQDPKIDLLFLDDESLGLVAKSRKFKIKNLNVADLGLALVHASSNNVLKRHFQWELLKLNSR